MNRFDERGKNGDGVEVEEKKEKKRVFKRDIIRFIIFIIIITSLIEFSQNMV